MELKRYRHLDRLESLLTRESVVAILGARQVGKTTLARQFAAVSRRRLSTVRADACGPRTWG
jgi:predicted AAA+ superfamily ATPase